jgi:hypothetical protein
MNSGVSPRFHSSFAEACKLPAFKVLCCDTWKRLKGLIDLGSISRLAIPDGHGKRTEKLFALSNGNDIVGTDLVFDRVFYVIPQLVSNRRGSKSERQKLFFEYAILDRVPMRSRR